MEENIREIGERLNPVLAEDLLDQLTESPLRFEEREGIYWISLEDAARGLGFVMTRDERVTTSGDSYQAVRWDRVKLHLANIGYTGEISKDAYIPENIFYRLAMRANNETAKRFQARVADLLVEYRRKGYILPKDDTAQFMAKLERARADISLADSLTPREILAIRNLDKPIEERIRALISPKKKIKAIDLMEQLSVNFSTLLELLKPYNIGRVQTKETMEIPVDIADKILEGF